MTTTFKKANLMTYDNEDGPIYSMLNGKVTGFIVSGVVGYHQTANGTYCPSSSPYNGRYWYPKTTDQNYVIDYESGRWVLYSFHGDGGDLVSSTASSNSMTPPLTGWSGGVTLSPVSC